LTAGGRTRSDELQAREPAAAVQAGVVGRPHGLQGAFYVNRPLAQLLAVGSVVNVSGRPYTVIRRAGTERHPIVALAGVGDRDAAALLRGAALMVARESAPALGADEWWAHELVGCEVFAGERPLGTVTRLVALPSCEALEVRRAGRTSAPLLIPMVKDAVHRVQPSEHRIEVDADFLADAIAAASPAPEVANGD
jgi:16S rRNA processing protein RimM